MSAPDTAAEILKVLRRGSATRNEIVETVGITHDTVSRWLRRWMAHGIVISVPAGGRGTGRLYSLAPPWVGPR